MRKNHLKSLVLFATTLAFVVVILGAYTRLSNAGLGCPDWPGCYGHIMVPAAGAHPGLYADQIVEPAKAWKEMIHRYAAGTLGLSLIAIFILAYRQRRAYSPTVSRITFALLFLLIAQAVLGMWTVTLKLYPIVVMSHLLGGITILSLLWVLQYQLPKRYSGEPDLFARKARRSTAPFFARPGVVFSAVVVVFIQIALGAWVSSNYAGISCVGFPMCNGQWLPTNFGHALHLFSAPIGPNYEGGVLDSETRASIQMVHRLWAYFTMAYLMTLLALLWQQRHFVIRAWAVVVLSLLLIQVSLGMINVLWMLPLTVAVAHNAIAALLLLSLLSLWHETKRETCNGL